jgi:site-specific recombinase XerD
VQGKPDDLTSFDTSTLRAFLYSLQQRSLRPRTVRSAFNPLRGLARYLVEHRLLTEDPALPLKLPKKDAARRELTSDDEIRAILEAIPRIYPERRAIMADAMLKTLIFGGTRFQEWLDIEVSHVNVQDGSILIAHGKGEKARTVWLPEECMDAIKKWLAVRGECRAGWLWMPNRSRRMGELGVRQLLEEVKTIAGLSACAYIKPHSIRHALATRMMNGGCPLTTISACLGHSSVVVTQAYLHMNEQQARKMSLYASVTPAKEAKGNENAPGSPGGLERESTERRRQTRISFQQKRRGRSA